MPRGRGNPPVLLEEADQPEGRHGGHARGARAGRAARGAAGAADKDSRGERARGFGATDTGAVGFRGDV